MGMVSGAVNWRDSPDRRAGTPGCTEVAINSSHVDVSTSNSDSGEDTPLPTSDNDGALNFTSNSDSGEDSPLPTGDTDGALVAGMPPLEPLRGIAYGALPCREHACRDAEGVSEDMLQASYMGQWGASGRDDLGTIAHLGGNAVRLYHSLGEGNDEDHSGFLNRST